MTPITSELDNLRKLESVGFNHEQAETLTDVIEKSHVDSHESLKEFIHNELTREISSLDAKLTKEISGLNVNISGLEVRLMASQKDILIKLFGIIVGTVGIAVTILKLFP
jgi:hypothetical protein